MKELVLFDFKNPKEVKEWISVNDDVMGGISSGSLVQLEPGIARFAGAISFENRGGFASIRTRSLSVKLTGFEGFELRVRGDGKKYKFRMKTDLGVEGFVHEIPFSTTSGAWETPRLLFAEAKAKLRGQTISFVPPLDPKKIKSISVLISDRQEGPFQLDLDCIKAFKN